MQYRALGKSGLKLSAVGLGGWTTFGGSVNNPKIISDIINRAFESGINFFDIADIYAKGESEKAMGEVLRKFPRHELVITSKAFWPMSEDINDRGLSRKHLIESCEKSLKRIGTDYLDLYFCHRYDEETPLEETIRAMDHLVNQGKILYWGTSEWTGEQMKAAHRICSDGGYHKPIVEQPQYNLIVRDKFENDVAGTVKQLGMGTVTWSPLGSGMLTGKYDNAKAEGRLQKIEWLKDTFMTEKNVERVKAMKLLSDHLQISRAELALAWLLKKSAVSSVILGVTSVEQLDLNLKALKVNLTDEVVKKLDSLFTN